MRNITPSFANRISHTIPRFFHDDYPLFVKFFEYYFQWKNRNGGFNNKDVERFCEVLGLDINTKDGLLEIIRLSNTQSPEQRMHTFPAEYLLERHSNIVETNEEEIFLTSDDEIYESDVLNTDVGIPSLRLQGGFYVNDPLSLESYDLILLHRMMPHINHIKGTSKAAEIFFGVFFGEDITQNVDEQGTYFHYPIQETIAIDGDLMIDSFAQIRDDVVYNEYSYVINTQYSKEHYEPMFSDVYMKYFHPSGFGCFLQQVGA